MKRIYIIFLISLFPLMTFAQGHHGQGRMQKFSHEEMRTEKVAYLTTQIDLSMDEAQKFWPIYNAYQKAFEVLITEAHDIMVSIDNDESNLSNTEVETKIDRLIQIDVEKAAVTSKYHELFKSVLSNQKIAKLYLAEHGFRRHLLEKYRQRGRGGNMPARN